MTKMLTSDELEAIWGRATTTPTTMLDAVETGRQAIQDRVDLLSHIAAVQNENFEIGLAGLKLLRDIETLQEGA